MPTEQGENLTGEGWANSYGVQSAPSPHKTPRAVANLSDCWPDWCGEDSHSGDQKIGPEANTARDVFFEMGMVLALVLSMVLAINVFVPAA